MSDTSRTRTPVPERGFLQLIPNTDAPRHEARMQALTRQYWSRLLVQATKLVGNAEAEDIVQEALLRYWRSDLRAVGEDPNPDPLRTLQTHMRDLVRERRRTSRRRDGKLRRLGASTTRYLGSHVAAIFNSGVQHWMAPGGEYERGEISPSITAAVDALPPQQRETVWLVSGLGYSYAQVAEMLGVSPKTVRANFWRGNAKLSVTLERFRPAGPRGPALPAGAVEREEDA